MMFEVLSSPTLLPWFIGFLGLFVGSFGNVVVYRLKHGGSIGFDRSKCRDCQHTLSVLDLVPVFSWVFLGGKCRYCKKKISWQYPLVELMFGAFWFFLAWKIGIGEGWQEWLYFAFLLFLISSLIIISVYDLLYMEIPDEVSFPAIGLSALALFLAASPEWKSALLGVLVIYSFFFLQILIPVFFHSWKNKKWKGFRSSLLSYFLFPLWVLASILLPKKIVEKISFFEDDEDDEEVAVWIGGGDLRLAFLMGLVLGLQKGLTALFIAYIVGALIGLGVVLITKKGRKAKLPFGPFLSIGTFLALFYGQQVWDWYWGILMF